MKKVMAVTAFVALFSTAMAAHAEDGFEALQRYHERMKTAQVEQKPKVEKRKVNTAEDITQRDEGEVKSGQRAKASPNS